jgi:hypothetical protein
MAMELLREAAIAAADGLPWYLLGRQYFTSGQYDEADHRFARALDLPIRVTRVQMETERLRLVAGCAAGDRARAQRGYMLYAAHPEVTAARRRAAAMLVARCTGEAPPQTAYDEAPGRPSR